MPKIRLRPIDPPKPGTRRVLEPKRGSASFTTKPLGDTDYLCGTARCSGLFAKGMHGKQAFKGLVFHCPECGKFSAV